MNQHTGRNLLASNGFAPDLQIAFGVTRWMCVTAAICLTNVFEERAHCDQHHSRHDRRTATAEPWAATIPAMIGTKAPVGSPICTRVPPKAEMRKPATIAVHSPEWG